jgi:hypothetical protein
MKRLRATWVTKRELAERTVATPTLRFWRTMLPPARPIAARALSAEAPRS